MIIRLCYSCLVESGLGSVSVQFGSSVGIPQIPVINLLISSPRIILPRDNYSQKSTNRIPEIPVRVWNSGRNPSGIGGGV